MGLRCFEFSKTDDSCFLSSSLRHGELGQWESPGQSSPVSPSSWRESPVWAQCNRQLYREGPPGHHGLPSHGWPPAFFLRGKKASWRSTHSPLPSITHGQWRGPVSAVPSYQPRGHVRGVQLWEYIPSLLSPVLSLSGQQRELYQPVS